MFKHKNPWKTLSSKHVYKNAWIKVREDKVINPLGKKSIYGVIEKSPAVFIIAVNPKKEIYLVGQYRYATGQYSLEIPAGTIEKDSPLSSAKRELWEETGLKAKKWQPIGKFKAVNDIANANCFVFLAQELKQTDINKMAEDGISEAIKLPIKAVAKLITQGKITDGPSIVAFYYYLSYIKSINL